MTTPDAIIFDYGRVLVGPLDETSFQADLDSLALEHGFASGLELWQHIYVSEAWEKGKRGQLTHDEFWTDRLTALGLDSEESQHNFKMRLYRHWGLRPAMRNLLDELRRNYRLAILSNTSRRNFAQYLIDQRRLGGLFEVVISSAEEGVAKPEQAIYRIALERLGLAPRQTLFIDDLARNTEAAEAVGIPAIVFTSPENLNTELRRRGIL